LLGGHGIHGPEKKIPARVARIEPRAERPADYHPKKRERQSHTNRQEAIMATPQNPTIIWERVSPGNYRAKNYPGLKITGYYITKDEALYRGDCGWYWIIEQEQDLSDTAVAGVNDPWVSDNCYSLRNAKRYAQGTVDYLASEVAS
jgi:hypothetical protein